MQLEHSDDNFGAKKFYNRLLKRTWGIVIIFCLDTQESTHFNYHDIYLFDIWPEMVHDEREWWQKKGTLEW